MRVPSLSRILQILLPVLALWFITSGCGDSTERPFCDLRAVPNPAPGCPNAPGAARVGWFCEDPVREVEVRVGSEKGDLFAEGGPYGYKSTGNWLFQDTRFFLLGKDSGRRLATTLVRVTNQSCK